MFSDDGGATPVQDEHPPSDEEEMKIDRRHSEVRLIKGTFLPLLKLVTMYLFQTCFFSGLLNRYVISSLRSIRQQWVFFSGFIIKKPEQIKTELNSLKYTPHSSLQYSAFLESFVGYWKVLQIGTPSFCWGT